MATIRQVPSGMWQAIVKQKGHPLQSKTFEKRSDAITWSAELEREIRLGTLGKKLVAERTTLKDLIADFKKEFAPHHYRVRADKKEAWRFQLDRLEEELGDYALAMLDQSAVAKYRDKRLRGSTERPAVGESTVRKELYLLSKVLGFAQKEKGVALPNGNPVDNVRKPKEGQGRDRRLSKEEWAAFERECKKSRNPWLWAAVQLAVETAMRQNCRRAFKSTQRCALKFTQGL